MKSPYLEQLEAERKSHDAEIKRIADKLNLQWPCTIEDIIKKINFLQGADEYNKEIRKLFNVPEGASMVEYIKELLSNF